MLGLITCSFCLGADMDAKLCECYYEYKRYPQKIARAVCACNANAIHYFSHHSFFLSSQPSYQARSHLHRNALVATAIESGFFATAACDESHDASYTILCFTAVTILCSRLINTSFKKPSTVHHESSKALPNTPKASKSKPQQLPPTMCLKSTYRYALCAHVADPAPKYRQAQDLRHARLRYSRPCSETQRLDASSEAQCSKTEESEVLIKEMCPTCLLSMSNGFKTKDLLDHERQGEQEKREILKGPHKVVWKKDSEGRMGVSMVRIAKKGTAEAVAPQKMIETKETVAPAPQDKTADTKSRSRQ